MFITGVAPGTWRICIIGILCAFQVIVITKTKSISATQMSQNAFLWGGYDVKAFGLRIGERSST